MKYLLFLLSVVTIPGCADRKDVAEYKMVVPPPAIARELSVISEEPAVDVTVVPLAIHQRKLIKTGAIDFEVNDIETTKKSIDNLVAEAGGYTSSEHEQHADGGPQFEQVLRIPSDKLDDFVSKITGLAKRVTSKNITTRDVSEEFIDIETRLVTKKDLEKNYREILRNARSVKEMLEVERELEDVRGEIESMEGRLQYLKSQVAFSTLTLTYFQVVPVVDETGFGDRVIASLDNGWFNVTEFTLGVLNAWPVITIGSIAALIMYVRVRRWIHQRREAVPVTTNQ